MNKPIQTTLIAVAMLAIASPAPAQTNADLLKELQALKARMAELEKKLSEKPSAPAPAPATTPAQAAGADKLKPDDSMKWSEFITGKSRFKIYGYLRADAIYDDSRPGGNGANSSLVPAFVLSENGLGGAANLAPGPNHENFDIHPRLTRLGVDFTGPEVESLWGAKTGGKLEIDFYNIVAGGAESREFLRMRHAYAQLKWDDAMFLAGQTSDLISQYFPTVNPDFVMWGAGNLGDRRPQFRGEWTPKLWGGTAFVQGMVGLTGADDNRDLDANGIRDGEASGLPTVQARIGYRFPLWEKQNIELALWTHHAREKVDIAIGGRNNFNSEAWGFDFSTPLYKDIVTFRGEGWTGKNIDDVRGGILQGVNVATGREIHAMGGWGELTFKPVKWYSFHTGYLFDNPRSSDLPVSSPELNSIWYLAARLYLDPMEFGLDYVNWTTYFKDATGPQGKGQDNRFQAYMSYKF